MTDTNFDEAAWIRRLGAALEDAAANATPRYSPIPPMPTGIRTIGEYDSALRLGYRNLAARAKEDRTAWKQFNESHLWVRTDPAEARAILREHALIKPWLVSSGQDEAVEVRTLNRTGRTELTWLVNCLAKLSVKEGGEEVPWCITLDNSKGISRLRFWAKNRRVNGINDLPVFMHQGTVPSESVAMPTGYGVRVDDEQAARPHGPRTSKGNPESPFRVVERWAWALFLQRRHLLPQSDVLQH